MSFGMLGIAPITNEEQMERKLAMELEQAEQLAYAIDLPQNMLFGAMVGEGVDPALRGKSYGFEDVRKANPTLDNIIKGATLPNSPTFNQTYPQPQPEAVDFAAEVLLDPINVPVASGLKSIAKGVKNQASKVMPTLTGQLPNYVPGYYGANQVGAMVNWLGTMGGPAAVKGLASGSAQALQKETGVVPTTQEVIKDNLKIMDSKEPTDSKYRLAHTVAVAQPQHNIMTHHMYGSGEMAPELQRIKELSYATDFMPLSRNNFMQGARKMNVTKEGAKRRTYADNETLSTMYDVMNQQWSKELNRAAEANTPVDIIFKEPTGISGNHLNDALGAKSGYNVIQRVFDPDKVLGASTAKSAKRGQLSYESPTELASAIAEAQTKVKTKGSGVVPITVTDNGVLVRAASLKSQSKLEGGVNHLMHVDLDGKVTHVTSDFYDFADKTARKIGVEQVLNDQANKAILSVVVPMISDARPEKYASKFVNSRTGVKKKVKVKGEDGRVVKDAKTGKAKTKDAVVPKESIKRQDLEALLPLKPSSEQVRLSQDEVAPFLAEMMAKSTGVGMLTVDNESKEATEEIHRVPYR